MFLAQFNKNQSPDECVLSASLPAISLLKNMEKKVKKTQFELQTRGVHNLSKLLRLKTVKMDKYGHVLDPKSNLYQRYQIVQSFLQIKLNKEKDNSVLNQQSLAQIVANSFNRRVYTRRKIVQQERSWVKDCKIPGSKAGKHKNVVSQMKNADLILFVKEWSRKLGENKISF